MPHPQSPLPKPTQLIPIGIVIWLSLWLGTGSWQAALITIVCGVIILLVYGTLLSRRERAIQNADTNPAAAKRAENANRFDMATIVIFGLAIAAAVIITALR